MEPVFIQVILTILTVAVLWGAYELYQTRKWLEDLAVETHEAAVRARTPPHLFDQETQ